jgi:hypothetical protein
MALVEFSQETVAFEVLSEKFLAAPLLIYLLLHHLLTEHFQIRCYLRFYEYKSITTYHDFPPTMALREQTPAIPHISDTLVPLRSKIGWHAKKFPPITLQATKHSILIWDGSFMGM